MKSCFQRLLSLVTLAVVTLALAACAAPSRVSEGPRQADVGLSPGGPVLGG